MFRSNNTNTSQDSQTVHKEVKQYYKQDIEEHSISSELMDKLLTTIKDQAEEIGILKQTITQLKQESAGRVSGAESSTLAGVG